jgi:hypothetical protein
VSAHNSGKKTKTQNPLAVFMLKAFVIDQSDFFVENSSKQSFIISLLLLGVGKKEVCFAWNQQLRLHFFNTQ